MRTSVLFILLLIFGIASAQEAEPRKEKTGLVLSGGGAIGLAHVGVLKALEEHDISVDYITGTSIGALIGALYATGFTPQEMEELFTSNRYYRMTKGEVEEKFRYYFNKKDPGASLLTISFLSDSIFKPVIPTNIVDPTAIDFQLVNDFAPAASSAGYNFDSLMVPFRCVASDIYNKEQVLFRAGNLTSAVRASMTYPFFLKPIKVDGNLLFDGGLYNNFPANIMCEEFNPDFIIGSNVVSKNKAPEEDDIISQIRNMMMSQTSFDVECADHIIIEPEPVAGTFQFDKAQMIINEGYRATIKQIEAIKQKNAPSKSSDQLNIKRKEFKEKLEPPVTAKVNIKGLNRRQTKYAEKVMTRKMKDEELSFDQIRDNYYRLYGDAAIGSVYPEFTRTDTSGRYRLDLTVKKEDDLSVDFGGNFASRPASHAFLGLTHNHLSTFAAQTDANTYFGRLYAAGHLSSTISFAGKLPFYIEPYGTIHRYNYFSSRTTGLLMQERPSYVLLRESFAGLDMGLPVGNRGKLTFGGSYFYFEDDYYQTRSFDVGDSADISVQEGFQFKVKYDQNNLNNRQWPTEGKRITFSMRYLDNRERQTPGSTAAFDETQNNLHQWFLARFKFENYFFKGRRINVGWSLDGAWSTQDLLSNYTATIVRAPAFQPTPESRVLFLESFRAYQFAASGLKLIYNFSDNLHLRAEGYLFQPIREINKEVDTQEAVYGDNFSRRYTVLSTSAVYDSPVGPVSLSVNYYHDDPDVALERQTPVTVFFNFGYILFNDRANDY